MFGILLRGKITPNTLSCGKQTPLEAPVMNWMQFAENCALLLECYNAQSAAYSEYLRFRGGAGKMSLTIYKNKVGDKTLPCGTSFALTKMSK